MVRLKQEWKTLHFNQTVPPSGETSLSHLTVRLAHLGIRNWQPSAPSKPSTHQTGHVPTTPEEQRIMELQETLKKEPDEARRLETINAYETLYGKIDSFLKDILLRDARKGTKAQSVPKTVDAVGVMEILHPSLKKKG